MTKKNPLSTEARVSLRHLRKQLNQDALDAARVFGQTEKMSSETMNVGEGLGLLDKAVGMHPA